MSSSPSPAPYFLLTRVLLDFAAEPEDLLEDIISDISAAALAPDGSLWVGSDEMIGVEKLSAIGCHHYGKHQRFLLQDYIKLFNTDDECRYRRDGFCRWLSLVDRFPQHQTQKTEKGRLGGKS